MAEIMAESLATDSERRRRASFLRSEKWFGRPIL